jgi:hypothetical protein
MIYSLTWLPAVLESAGLKVATVPGWESRGRSEMGTVLGVMCHHTVGPRNGNMPSLNLLVRGRDDLPGPLSQLGLGRDGTYYVIAAGRCNHAGVGSWRSISTGNSSFIGVEAENTGSANDSWPEVQMDAYRRGVAAVLTHVGRGPELCVGHKEYALPQGRKPDPNFDMEQFRQAVAGFMTGTLSAPALIPRVEPPAPAGGSARPTLRRGDTGEFVKQLQQKLMLIPADGFFGSLTEAATRAFQRQHGLVPDGIVGPKSWAALDAA